VQRGCIVIGKTGNACFLFLISFQSAALDGCLSIIKLDVVDRRFPLTTTINTKGKKIGCTQRIKDCNGSFQE
jgi:hypothetical protein